MLRIRKYDAINFIVLFFLLWVASAVRLSDRLVNKCFVYVSILSIGLLIYQIVALKKWYGIEYVSTLSIFIVLCYVFNFGNFYIKMAGKDQFYIFFRDWFGDDIKAKADVGYLSLCMIQALFTGIGLSASSERRKQNEYRCFLNQSDAKKNNAILFSGIILLCIALPCRLYWDYNQVLLGRSNGYIGGYSEAGLIDDIAVLFVPALICIVYAKRDKPSLGKCVLLLYGLYSVVIMLLSGSRRSYITSLVALFIFYYQCFVYRSENRSRFVRGIVLVLLAAIVLNLLSMIKNYRHSNLGSILLEHSDELLSFDFIWETLGEFGGTGIPAYYAYKLFPSQIRFFYGMNFLMSIVFILPIGWLANFTFVTTALNNQIHLNGLFVNTGLGSSILCELFCDFGYLSIVMAVLAGYCLAEIGNTQMYENEISIKTVIRSAMGIAIINYARGSTSEVFRSIGYTLVGILFFCAVYISFANRKVLSWRNL